MIKKGSSFKGFDIVMSPNPTVKIMEKCVVSSILLQSLVVTIDKRRVRRWPSTRCFLKTLKSSFGWVPLPWLISIMLP